MSKDPTRQPLAARLRGIVGALPDTASVMLPVSELRSWIEADSTGPTEAPAPHGAAVATWRVQLWTVPAETRIGVPELCEALDRGPDFVYRHTSPKATRRLPHRKLGGELEFVVGEVREWLRSTEDVIVRGPSDVARSLRVS